MNKASILFISDGSILNPILHSQGFPLLDYITETGFHSFVFSREKLSEDLKLQKDIKKVKERFNRINFVHSVEKHHNFAGWVINLYGDIKVINKIVASEQINIIHSRSLFPGLLGLFFKLKNSGRIKLIYDNRGLIITEEIENKRWKNKGIRTGLLKFLENQLLKLSDSIVVVSKRFRSYLVKKYPEYSLETKINVIPNRTNIDGINQDVIKKNNHSPVCVYSGSSAKWQSVDEFEKIIDTAVNVFKEIEFLILSYHIEEFQKTLSHKSEISNKIRFRSVSQDKVFEHLSECNFGLLIRENNLINNVASPLKFAEYLSAGLPVMVSEGVGDTEKLIEDYKVGVVIRDYNYSKALAEMKNLLNDPQIYGRCRNLAEKEFDLRDTFKEYLNIYWKLLEQ